jgi:hypothetical protein
MKTYGLRDRSTLRTRANTKFVYHENVEDVENDEEEETKRAIQASLASFKSENQDYVRGYFIKLELFSSQHISCLF